jgi:hypothetical protein
MYGGGTEIDEIGGGATIETSFGVSRLRVVIAFVYSEHVWHIIEGAYVNFQ